ncbi:T9SS-dependent choice-of-anchor J family protein [Xanthomarina spongicola]|uniref:Putative secreted protein (Por secretion system target) n=1 Tax=Xanthomarina spongicola TaxID=570520 RepID=A0A316DN71_9FLAO|nr:choice-of-anchor J domain-containing protein [Xanthomarina spongicola]PWK19514.1 putative secreted protein (Por secretion system target) [Xanthomarina spongicola]
MKKITFLLFACVAFCWQANAQFTESFDTEIPTTWTILNEDGGTYTWTHQTQYPQAGAGHARIHWETAAHNDFLITPQFSVTANVSDRISFFAGIDGTFWTETFDVRVSTTGTAAGDFTTIASETATTDADGNYTKYTYDLSAYNGMNVYVAIVATDTDRFYLYVDEFVNDGVPTCTPGVANATIIEDCNSSSYTIEVVVTNVGDATTITDGVTSLAFTGTVTFGPYAFGVDTTLDVVHSDGACDFTLGTYTMNACPTQNDECANAIDLDAYANSDGSCTLTYVGSNIGATFSAAEGAPSATCVDGSATPADIWFTYTVPASGTFDFEFITNPGFSSIVELYTGTCGSLTAWTPVNCANSASRTFSGLTPASTVYLRVWDYGSDDEGTLELCVNYVNCSATVVDSSTVVPDCGNDQFSVDLVVSSVNDGTFVTDGLGGSFAVVAGTVTAGPYADASTVTLTVEHSDGACDYSLGDFSNTCGPSENCGAYSSSPGSAITTGTPVNDIITVSGTGPQVLLDLNVIVKINHTFLGDLEITLTSPTGTVVDLMFDQCLGNDNMDIEFDDDGVAIVCGTPTIGTFTLSNTTGALLADFDDETFDGDWTLTVVDDAGGDDGTLIQWCLVPALYNLGIEELSPDNFSYYPNPVNENLTLKAQKNIENVAIYNMLGQEVLRTAPNTLDSDIDMSNLQPGTYFVKVTVENATKTIKVIKK